MERNVGVKVKKLHADAIIPSYEKEGDAGFDLHAIADVAIAPGECVLVPTGLAFEIPRGFEIQIRLRSGVAAKTSLILANAPGTIDSGYRGEIRLIVRNLGKTTVMVQKGDRLAQGVLAPVYTAVFTEVDGLSWSERGTSGFGSTGR